MKATEHLIEELEIFGRNNEGYFNIPPETGKFFFILVSALRPNNILEVGTSNGYSTLLLAEAAKSYGGKVTTIEISESKAKMAADNFKKVGLSNIKLIQGDALEEIPKLMEKFDFLFLDAVKSDYISYFKLMESKLTKDALIVADNAEMFKDRMHDYLEYVRDRYQSVLVPIGTGVEMSLQLR